MKNTGRTIFTLGRGSSVFAPHILDQFRNKRSSRLYILVNDWWSQDILIKNYDDFSVVEEGENERFLVIRWVAWFKIELDSLVALPIICWEPILYVFLDYKVQSRISGNSRCSGVITDSVLSCWNDCPGIFHVLYGKVESACYFC